MEKMTIITNVSSFDIGWWSDLLIDLNNRSPVLNYVIILSLHLMKNVNEVEQLYSLIMRNNEKHVYKPYLFNPLVQCVIDETNVEQYIDLYNKKPEFMRQVQIKSNSLTNTFGSRNEIEKRMTSSPIPFRSDVGGGYIINDSVFTGVDGSFIYSNHDLNSIVVESTPDGCYRIWAVDSKHKITKFAKGDFCEEGE